MCTLFLCFDTKVFSGTVLDPRVLPGRGHIGRGQGRSTWGHQKWCNAPLPQCDTYHRTPSLCSATSCSHTHCKRESMLSKHNASILHCNHVCKQSYYQVLQSTDMVCPAAYGLLLWKQGHCSGAMQSLRWRTWNQSANQLIYSILYVWWFIY